MVNAPENTLPCSCYRREDRECHDNALSVQNTDVSHVSIRVNLDQNVSTSSKVCYQSTMLRFRDAENLGQYCDFSRDLEARASFGCFAAICHLRSQALSVSSQGRPLRINSRFSFFISLEIFSKFSENKLDKPSGP